MRDKPTPPEDYECCQSECSPCVWDTYYEDLSLWQTEQTALENSPASNAEETDSTQ